MTADSIQQCVLAECSGSLHKHASQPEGRDRREVNAADHLAHDPSLDHIQLTVLLESAVARSGAALRAAAAC